MPLIARLFAFLGLASLVSVTLIGWHLSLGFDPLNVAWWHWLRAVWLESGWFPPEILNPAYAGFGAFALFFCVGAYASSGAKSKTVSGGRKQKDIHGTARWAILKDVRKSGLWSKSGVVVGGWPRWRGVRMLRHNGPEHVLAFAPTRSGKGVGLVLPTLLSWRESALVLDIKGENHALTAGWRASQGQNIYRFDPAAHSGSAKYNPLAEVRMGTDHEIADCQNIAIMIIDPDGAGLKDFWMQEGYGWLSTAILHVLYRVQKEDDRRATLADVRAFMSMGQESKGSESKEPESNGTQSGPGPAQPQLAETSDEPGEEPATSEQDTRVSDSFERLLLDMESYDHGRDAVNAEVRLGAARMRKRADNERSGVHSTGTAQLSLYSDPIVARNTSASDFCISDLMNGEKPATLYIVIPPSEIARLRPLVRILLNQVLTRLTSHMAFEGGVR